MKNNNSSNIYDVVIIGAGPAGLSFACSLANQDQKILVVEKSPHTSISDPKPDGRETALPIIH